MDRLAGYFPKLFAHGGPDAPKPCLHGTILLPVSGSQLENSNVKRSNSAEAGQLPAWQAADRIHFRLDPSWMCSIALLGNRPKIRQSN